MSIANVSALAAALRAQLTPDPGIILEGLDPVPLPGDKARTQDAKAPADPDPKTAKPPPSPPVQAAEAARQTAAGRQLSVAPLMADLEQAIRNEVLPAPVRAAAEKVLSLQTPIEARVTSDTIKQAVSRSGLFLETRLADPKAAAAPPPPDLKSALLVLRQVLRAAAPPPQVPAASPQVPAAGPSSAPVSGAPAASPQQPLSPQPAQPPPRGLAASYAPPSGVQLPQIDTALMAPAAPRPAAAPAPAFVTAPASQASAAAIAAPPAPPLANPPPLGASPSMAPQVPSQAPPPNAPQAGAPLATLSGSPAPALAPPTVAPNAPPLPQRATTQGQTFILPAPPAAPDAETTALLTARPEVRGERAASAAAHEAPPAPPVKGAPPTAQKAAAAHLPESSDPASVIRHLERATSGAIARTELFQLASLPDAPRADGDLSAKTQSWLFEVPLATQRGPAVAQFEIEKDGSNGQAGREGPAWRTRFSVDVEPLGLIHALLVLMGGKTTVTLWAERRDTLARLRRDQAQLAQTLDAEIAVHPGSPVQPVARSGRFLDASS